MRGPGTGSGGLDLRPEDHTDTSGLSDAEWVLIERFQRGLALMAAFFHGLPEVTEVRVGFVCGSLPGPLYAILADDTEMRPGIVAFGPTPVHPLVCEAIQRIARLGEIAACDPPVIVLRPTTARATDLLVWSSLAAPQANADYQETLAVAMDHAASVEVEDVREGLVPYG